MRFSSGRSKKYADAPPSTSTCATSSPSVATFRLGWKRELRSRLPTTIAGMPLRARVGEHRLRATAAAARAGSGAGPRPPANRASCRSRSPARSRRSPPSRTRSACARPARAGAAPGSGVTPAGGAAAPNGAGAPANAPLNTVDVPPAGVGRRQRGVGGRAAGSSSAYRARLARVERLLGRRAGRRCRAACAARRAGPRAAPTSVLRGAQRLVRPDRLVAQVGAGRLALRRARRSRTGRRRRSGRCRCATSAGGCAGWAPVA